MCATLAEDPRAISPTKISHSVHNAAALLDHRQRCVQATTAISAHDASFAQGLLEALLQLRDGSEAVLLAAYDTTAVRAAGAGPNSQGLLGGALLLSNRATGYACARPGPTYRGVGAGPAIAPRRGQFHGQMLPLSIALAAGDDVAI